MTISKFTAEQLNGARSLIQDGLKLKPPHTLLLLYQNDLANAARCIEQAASELEVNVDSRSFIREDFFYRYPNAFSPDNLAASGIPPSGIALLIEWSEETTLARLDLITDLTNEVRPWRVASMPGVDLEGLTLCSSDFQAINNYSRIAFAVLARALSATLKTVNPDGVLDELHIPLRKSYCPIISTGEIDPNSWGNFPSGETFVVPDEFCARGKVTIRGSIPLRPLKPEEWVRFELHRGRIIFYSLEASSEELKDQFKALIFKQKGSVKCANSNALAELGIGTNPGIVHLTGKPIFDEKKLGTVHIAFGKNTQFTGPLKSCIHHDIVCTEPTLMFSTSLREFDLIRDGQFVVDAEQAVPKFEELPENFLKHSRNVNTGDVAYQFIAETPNGSPARIRTDYASNRQQNVSLTIAEGETAFLANQILKVVSEKRRMTVKEIVGLFEVQYQSRKCEQAVAGLLEYGLLK
jgi:Thermophilic metalloprotease (M29)